MRVHCLSHVPYEGPGILRDWAEARGWSLTEWPLFENPSLPAIDDIDWLIVMGGPMSVHDTDQLDWLAPETTLIRDLLAGIRSGRDAYALGICLGAQLLAEALGGEVTRLAEAEIGWWPIELADEAGPLAHWPARFDGFHWHGEGFSLPPGAQSLASSRHCPHQAFSFGERILGLQFHAEMRPAEVELLVRTHTPLPAGAAIQSGAEMLADPARFAAENQRLIRLLEGWLPA